MSEDEIRAAVAKRDPAQNLQRGHVLIDYVLKHA